MMKTKIILSFFVIIFVGGMVHNAFRSVSTNLENYAASVVAITNQTSTTENLARQDFTNVPSKIGETKQVGIRDKSGNSVNRLEHKTKQELQDDPTLSEQMQQAIEKKEFPYGLFDFEIQLGNPGETANISIALPEQIDTSRFRYYKIQNGALLDITHLVTYEDVSIDGQVVTTINYQITDGSNLDDDGEVNGVVVDPSGGGTDITSPSVLSTVPEDNALGVSLSKNLEIFFDEAVRWTVGMVQIFRSTDDSLFESIDVVQDDGTKIYFGGSGTGSGFGTGAAYSHVILDPQNDLEEYTDYYIQIDHGTFEDTSGNGWSGISDTSTWNFQSAFVYGKGSAILEEEGASVKRTNSSRSTSGNRHISIPAKVMPTYIATKQENVDKNTCVEKRIDYRRCGTGEELMLFDEFREDALCEGFIDETSSGLKREVSRKEALHVALRMHRLDGRVAPIVDQEDYKNTYLDVSNPDMKAVIETGFKYGLISDQRDMFRPSRSVRRSEAYAMVMKSVCMEMPPAPYISWERGIHGVAHANNLTLRNWERFHSARPITRQEFYVLVSRAADAAHKYGGCRSEEQDKICASQ